MADFSQTQLTDLKQLEVIGHHYMPATDKWIMTDLGADYIYLGPHLPEFMLPNGLKGILDAAAWEQQGDKTNFHPLYSVNKYDAQQDSLNFLSIDIDAESLPSELNNSTVLLIQTKEASAMASLRRFVFRLMKDSVTNPVMIGRTYEDLDYETMQLYAATDMGGLLIDGLGDGVMLTYADRKQANATAFGILQAARTRMTKTEYISCPSCGRTLFDLQQTTAMIRNQTDHLKGVKIGIMGCIVNGPGEMADADYGYVGSGKGKITLYKGQEVVKRNIPSEGAVDELIELIKTYDDWVEPEEVNM